MYKVDVFGLEGLLVSMALLILPLIILYVLTKILPPWHTSEKTLMPSQARGTGNINPSAGATG